MSENFTLRQIPVASDFEKININLLITKCYIQTTHCGANIAVKLDTPGTI